MLTSCPECNHEVSDKAESCPNCGHPFLQRNVVFIKKVTKKTELKYLGLWSPDDPALSFLKLGIIGLGLVLTIYGAISDYDVIPFGVALLLFIPLLILGELDYTIGYPAYWGYRYFKPRAIKYRIMRRRLRLAPPKMKQVQDPEDELHNSQLIEPLTPDDL